MTTRLLVTVPDTALAEELGDVGADVDVRLWDLVSPAPAPSIDIVVPPYMGAHAVLANLAGVATRLVQSQSVGYDGIADVLPAGHVYANAASVHETSTSELTLALVLASQRGLPEFVRQSDATRPDQ